VGRTHFHVRGRVLDESLDPVNEDGQQVWDNRSPMGHTRADPSGRAGGQWRDEGSRRRPHRRGVLAPSVADVRCSGMNRSACRARQHSEHHATIRRFTERRNASSSVTGR
jgi:hypothetical protein